MSNIVDFLEMIGESAKLRYASVENLRRMLVDNHMDREVRKAVLAGDQQRLSELFKVQTKCCILMLS